MNVRKTCSNKEKENETGIGKHNDAFRFSSIVV